MICLAWNCRGLGSPGAENALKGVIQIERPHFVFLSETKLKDKEWESTRRKVRLRDFICVDCEGEGRHRKGGLTMFWDNDVTLDFLSSSQNHMDFIVRLEGGRDWRLTGVYGFPEEERKAETWNLLVILCRESELPLVCMGDFNGILSHDEKVGGIPKHQREIDGFRSAIGRCSLRDIHFEGFPFTWMNNRVEGENVHERLDRVLVSETLFDRYPCSIVEHLPQRLSDHLPIKLRVQEQVLVTQGRRRRRKGFRVEKEWLRED
ncbi:uncharacterized protein [Spinacia oleracea]|uniref:Endonuclease/exonuclease/phosphatase domain-containing protein n=1 Tax=Spinacia oleracea TaxID=3562 RepID=A0A9R0INE8_SPIOL|nr:uncharacterized protein LOC110790846 [Spinacia oleracea]